MLGHHDGGVTQLVHRFSNAAGRLFFIGSCFYPQIAHLEVGFVDPGFFPLPDQNQPIRLALITARASSKYKK